MAETWSLWLDIKTLLLTVGAHSQAAGVTAASGEPGCSER